MRGIAAVVNFRISGGAAQLRVVVSLLVAHSRAREMSGAIAGGGEFLFRDIRWCCSATGSSSIDPRARPIAPHGPAGLARSRLAPQGSMSRREIDLPRPTCPERDRREPPVRRSGAREVAA